MNLQEFIEFVADRVEKLYGTVTERNVLRYLDNECFLSPDETLMVLNALKEKGKC